LESKSSEHISGIAPQNKDHIAKLITHNHDML
jgi:hypothetical protein